MRPVITFATAAIVAGVIVPHYAEQLRSRSPHNVSMQTSSSTHSSSSTHTANPTAETVEVPRDDGGHFRIDGRIDGRTLGFMVDTGASLIALTADDAERLGLHPAPRDYTMLMQTANGRLRAAPVTLDMVEIGDIAVHDVAAVVMPAGALGENLLGMSFLSQLHRFDYSGGKMVLEQ